jgi:hypothetical protein
MPQKIYEQLRKVKIICKTVMVCKKIKNACGVNDTVCTMYAVSITPHAGFSQKLLQNEHFHQNLKTIFVSTLLKSPFL